ncbi:MAG: hypothetical protein KUL75_01805 [Sterolibacterium sp.]|nr:hypothetical protein [Sterolibacterium sp.]
MMLLRSFLLVCALWLALPAAALEYRSVSEAAVLYDAPSLKGTPLFVIARQTPVEVVVALDGWSKVRDAAGGLAWIEKRLLGERRMVQVVASPAQIRTAANPEATLVFEAERDVLLELTDPLPGNGWARVRHRDGQAGFVRVEQVWGL